MAWKWVITDVVYDTASYGMIVYVKIYRDTWTMSDKALLRSWNFMSTAIPTVADIAVKVQAEITAYQALKDAQTTLNASIGVEQTVV